MTTKLNIPDHQDEAVWVRAWCATASVVNCRDSEVATKWADYCLQEFKQRFRKDLENQTNKENIK